MKAQSASDRVALQRTHCVTGRGGVTVRPHDLREQALGLSAEVVQLPEAVLGHGVAVTEEEVGLGFRHHLGNSPVVSKDLGAASHTGANRTGEPGQSQLQLPAPPDSGTPPR